MQIDIESLSDLQLQRVNNVRLADIRRNFVDYRNLFESTHATSPSKTRYAELALEAASEFAAWTGHSLVDDEDDVVLEKMFLASVGEYMTVAAAAEGDLSDEERVASSDMIGQAAAVGRYLYKRCIENPNGHLAKQGAAVIEMHKRFNTLRHQEAYGV
jgi:hypothetical protein